MLGLVWFKFFISDPEEVEQSENFRTADHIKPFRAGKCFAKGESESWREGIEWDAKWQRHVSVGKRKVMHSDKNNPRTGAGFQAISFDPELDCLLKAVAVA